MLAAERAVQRARFVILHSAFFTWMPGRLMSRTPPFEGERGGASPSPAAISKAECRVRSAKSSSETADGLTSCSFRTSHSEFRISYARW